MRRFARPVSVVLLVAFWLDTALVPVRGLAAARPSLLSVTRSPGRALLPTTRSGASLRSQPSAADTVTAPARPPLVTSTVLSPTFPGGVPLHANTAAQSVDGTVDLRTWAPQSGPFHGDWQTAADGRSVEQRVMSGPTFLVSPDLHQNILVRGRISIPRTAEGDGFVGLAFGYRSPVASEGHRSDQFDLVLFDWKRRTELRDEGTALEGLTLSRIRGLVGDDWATFGQHAPAASVELIASRLGRAQGWKPGREYVVEVAYRLSRIRISVDGNVVFDAPGSFPEGWIGLYTYGQAGATFSDVSVEAVNGAPVAAAGPDVSVEAGAACVANVALDGSRSSDPDGDALTHTWTGAFGTARGDRATVALPRGMHPVGLTVDDGGGLTSSDELSVAIVDSRPPTLACPADIEITSLEAVAASKVSLGTPAAADQCGVASLTNNAPDLFPFGTTTVAWTASDAAGNVATCAQTVTLVSLDAPSVSVSLERDLLWAPAHVFGDVGLTAVASDPSGVPPVLRIEVWADEPAEDRTGDGHHDPDGLIEDGRLRLRNERKGDADGRVYLVIATVTNAAGVTSHACTAAVVPHDETPESEALVRAQAAAALEHCRAHGAPPPNFYPVVEGAFPVTAPTQPVRPLVECVVEHGPGAYTAVFGYHNENPVPVYLPVGPANLFDPAPIDRGQPTAFRPGRSPSGEGAFVAQFDGSDLVWTVRGLSVTASAASPAIPRCQAPPATPVAGDDHATTLEDEPVVIAVLANDSDPQGDALRILRVTSPSNGTVLLAANGTITYTPRAGFVGEDVFTYTVGDDEFGTDQAMVIVTVVPRNVAPTVAAGPDQTTNMAVASLTGSVTDDGRPLEGALTSVWTLVSGPAPVTFVDPASPRTEVRFALAGTYVLRLAASDTALSAFDDLTVTVIPSVSIADASIAEGHSGLTEIALQVVVSVPSPEAISVDFVTEGGTASPGCDYLPRVGTVRFAPGETSHEIIVPVVGELDVEADETVFVRLGNAAGAVLARAESTLTIQNDDAPNQPPSALADRLPADGATRLPLNPALSWTSADPDGDPVTHDVYFGTSFSTTGQFWTRLCSAGAGPGPRAAAGTAYDEAGDRLIVFGGQTGADTDASDVWILDHATGAGGAPAWSPVAAAGGPAARRQAVAGYDPGTNRLIVHGGCTGDCTSALADTWVLDLSTARWTELPASPGARTGHGAIYDAASNRLMLFGGSEGGPDADRNDVWVLRDANGIGSPAWELLATDAAPAPRRNASLVYDAATNRLIVFGGRQGADTLFNDVWALSHANGLGGTPSWTQLAPEGNVPAPRWGHSAAYDAVSRRLLVFGGTGVGFESDRNLVANDLWLLTEGDGPTSPAWVRLMPSSGPPDARFLSSVAYSSTLNRLVVTLGANNRLDPQLRDDLWTLADAMGSLPLVAADQADTTWPSVTPAASDTYYWRIFTRDRAGAVTGSPVWRFRPNAPPTVDAGPDQEIAWPANTITLTGTAADDGLPTGGSVSVVWTVASGPGDVVFDNASHVVTSARLDVAGTYVLRLTATDGDLSASDDLTVVVRPRPSAGRTYTSNADFSEGVRTAVDTATPDQLQLEGKGQTFGFIWVAVSTKGTAVKIDTQTGVIKGEYRTAPQGQPTDPSRTTVDLSGNVWTANRAGNSVVHIGLLENGQCVDRNGNGVIDTSTGQNDIRPWTNAGGADTNGGVSTAADECIIHYVRVTSFGTRHVSVDANNDVWVSGITGRQFDLIDGRTGVIKRREPSVGFGGYGGLIDRNGVIWSARPLLRWDTARPLTGPNGGNWTGYGHDSYGLCIDSQGNVWETALSGNILRKWAPDGRLLGSFPHGHSNAQGCVVDRDDHVWVAHSLLGSNSVGRVKNDGTFIGNVTVGSGPTGVAVDSAGKIWATNYNSRTVSRINPLAGPIGLDGITRVGAVDLTTVDLGGNPYNYSDMTGSTLQAPPQVGNWIVVFDSGLLGAEWGTVTWNASVCGDGAVTVTAATSADGVAFSLPQLVTPGDDLTVPDGRYLRVTVRLERARGGESPILYDLSVGTVGYPLLPPTPANAAPSVNAGTDQTVILPRKATLAGTACDDGRPSPLNISWQQVSGTGTTTFTPANAPATTAAFSAPGTYVLRLSASDTELTSSDEVTVIAAEPVCLPPPPGEEFLPGLNAWWPGDGNANDIVNGRRGTLFGGMGFGSGMVGQAFVFDGVDDHVTVPASTELNVQSFTVDAWVFPTTLSTQRPLIEWGQPGIIGVHLWESFQLGAASSPGALYANVVDVAGGSHTIGTGPGALVPNQWSHVALTYDRATGRARLYVNGQIVATNILGSFQPRTALPLNLGFRPTGGQRFIGRLDEVDLFSRALSPVEIEDIYLAGALGKCKTPNDRPIVDAGVDQVLVLPTNTTTLMGTVTDDGRPPGGLTVTWSQVSGPAAAIFGSPSSLQTTVTFPAGGVYVLKLSANDSELVGQDDVTVTVNQRSDLTVRSLDVAGVVYEGQTLEVSGSASAEIANIGGGPAGGSFSVAFFEDRNGNGTFEAGADALLGTGVQDDLLVGATATVTAALSGTVLFRGNLIYAFVDSEGAIPEGNEANNYGSSAPPCEAAPPGGPFAPRLEWAWTGSPVQPTSNQVMMAPAVADLNADGVPDVIFSTFIPNNYTTNGTLRAVSGRDGAALFTVTDASYRVTGAGSIAVGDIDLDGRPEILAVHESRNKIIALEHDGTPKWTSAALEAFAELWGGAALADLDGNGVPEIVVGRQVLNASNGTVRWTGTGGRGDNGLGPLSLVADLDMDGRPEVVAGNTAYLGSGGILWRNTTVPDGFNAVANFDNDPFPEIVLVSGGTVRLLEHTGEVKWGPVSIPTTILPNRGGPPTVGDFDNDGQVEIGVAGASRYVVIETNGTIKWQAVTQDNSSNLTGSAVFDFEGDGSVEVVYADELKLRVYRGSDGTVLWETARPSGTTYELPIVADVDGDGRAEILVPSNNYAFAGATGLQVYGDDNWVATRRIWNQHTYHITNVNEDGTIPAREPNNWETYNNYRQNRLAVGCEFSKPDLVASYARKVEDAGLMHVTVRVGNGGGSAVGSGVPVSFYDGDPAAGGRLLGTAPTAAPIAPGRFEDVVFTLPLGTIALPLWIVADDQGGLVGTIAESDEANNAYNSGIFLTAAPNEPPTVDAGPDRTTTLPAGTVMLDGSVADDGLPIDQLTQSWSVVSGPGPVVFGDPAATDTSATFTVAGTYLLRLTASDADLMAADDVTVIVQPANQAPVVNAGPDRTITSPIATLAGTVTDDGLPAGNVVTIAWIQVIGPAPVVFDSPSTSTTNVTFSADGEYLLRLTASDGELTRNDDVRLTVSRENQRPLVSAGADQSITLPSNVLALDGSASDDGLPAGSTLRVSWKLASGPAPVVFVPTDAADATVTFSDPGLYVLRLEATDSVLVGGDNVTVLVQPAAPEGAAPAIALTSPVDGSVVTGPVDILGSAESATLASWRLEYRLEGDPTWTRFAGSTEPVTGGVLASFDPTLLLNGLYEVRLAATDISGRISTTSFTAVVEGAQKVGHFTISFTDLEVPVSGLPIRIGRTYDSRDKRTGEFGVGWRLDLTTIRINENGVPGQNWLATTRPGFFPTYCVEANRPHLVSFTLPGGRVQTFQMVIAPSCQVLFPIQFAQVSLQPVGNTVGRLVPADSRDVWVVGGLAGPVELYDDGSFDLYDPSLYEYTSPEGDVFLVHQSGGLRSVRDRNGNTLTVGPGGITHSAGKSVVFTRDSQGRITRITDAAGNPMIYEYDGNGDLVAYTDRENATTTFTYHAAFPHHLDEIKDPLGRTPVRTEYYDDGRIKSHTDAFGKTIAYGYDLDAREQTITDRNGDVRAFEYDDRGNVVKETQPDGRIIRRTFDARNNRTSETVPHEPDAANPPKTTWVYDSQDNLLSVTDALNNVTTYTYNARRQVMTAKDPRGTFTINAYDDRGNLISTKVAKTLGGPPLSEVGYTYDARGNPLTQSTFVDGVACTTRADYDGFGNLSAQTDGLGHRTQYSYDASSNRLTQTTTRTVRGVTETLLTRYAYDRQGRLVKTTDPDGSSTRNVYDEFGRIKESFDKFDRKTTYTYDEMGRQIKKVYVDGTFEESTYDNEGRRLTFRGRSGQITRDEYDGLGRLTKTTYSDEASVENRYDAAGRLIEFKDARGNTTFYGYDEAGQRRSIRMPLDAAAGSFAETLFTYDRSGNQTSIRDANLHTTRYEYDEQGRRTKVIFDDDTFIETTYDSAGRRRSERDQAGKITRFDYDCAGRLTKVTDAAGKETFYEYDEVGNLILVRDANGHETRFEHDKAGRETRRTLPDGKFETGTYDAAGNLATRIDFMGRTIAYAYDSNDRLVSRALQGGAELARFTYTATGRRETAADSRGVTSYEYDRRDRLQTLLFPDGRKLEYEYDANGNRTGLTAVLADGTRLASGYSYDAANRLDRVTDPLGRSYDHGYDGPGNRTSLAYPNGVATAYAYDALNRLTNLSTTHPASGRTVQSYALTLAPAGNRTAIAEDDGTVRSYEYDDVYRLTGERVTLGGVLNYEKVFTYDGVGNRLTQTTSGAGAPGTPTAAGSIGYSYDDRDRLASETLESNPPTSYTFGDNGNLVAKSSEASYAWNVENRLVRVVKTEGTVVEYAYDADGNRVRTKVTPATGPPTITEYLVDPSGPLSHAVAETNESGTLIAYYLRGDDLLAVMRPDGSGSWTSRFFHADGVGSIRRLTDETAAVTDSYTYTAFGELLVHTGSDPQPYAFAGEPYDPNVGFQYHRERWLDVRLGRFASMDPFSGTFQDPRTLHKYLYVSNDPANRIDPTGQFEFSIAGLTISISIANTLRGIALGFTFGALASAGDAYLRGDDVLAAALQGGLIGAVLGPLFQIKFVAQVLVTAGTALTVLGVADAIEQGNAALAAYRSLFVLLGAVTFFKPPPGPPPTGGRLGSASTRQQLSEIAAELIRRGWTIVGGGGRLPEEYLPPAGGGRSGGNYVDLTAVKNGQTLRINTVDTYVNGLPTAREAAAAALIRQKTGGHLLLIPKER